MIWEIKPRERQLYVSGATVDHILIYGSGGSSISPDEKLIALSDLVNGFEFYALSDQRRIYTINPNPSEHVPTSVLFDLHGSIMFGGSSGAAYIASGTPPVIKQSLKCEGRCFLWAESSGLHIDYFFTGDEFVTILVSTAPPFRRLVKRSDVAKGIHCSLQEDVFPCDRDLWSGERNSD